MSKLLHVAISELTKARSYEEVLKSLLTNNYHVRVYFLGERNSDFVKRLNLLNNRFLKLYCYESTPRFYLSFILGLGKLPDQVLFSGWKASKILLPLCWFVRVKKRLYVRHHGNIHYKDYLPVLSAFRARQFDKLLQFCATRIVAVSPIQRELICLETRSVSKIEVIPNSISHVFTNIKSQELDSRLLHAKNTEYRFGFVARSTRWKGIHIGLRALAELRQEGYNFSIDLVTTGGDYLSAIQSLVDELELREMVNVIPFVESIRDFYRGIDCLIHVPLGIFEESFGLAPVEALAHGVPVIATPSGILATDRQLQNCCYLVKYGDIAGVLSAAKQLMAANSTRREIPPKEYFEPYLDENFVLRFLKILEE